MAHAGAMECGETHERNHNTRNIEKAISAAHVRAETYHCDEIRSIDFPPGLDTQYLAVIESVTTTSCTSRPIGPAPMRCPYCGTNDDKVLDSREAQDGSTIRRRRECKGCGRRYTTFEQTEEMELYVVKRSGRREPYQREKVLQGMRIACKGRPISADTLEAAADDIERLLLNRLEREVPTEVIGEMVVERLRTIDQVAFVRFASVYRQFEDATQFKEIVNRLRRRRS